MMKNITVYLADDQTLFRKGMIRLLQSFECISHIVEAENGKKLIDLVEMREPDVVLMDVRMPVMDGFDTCAYLKRNHSQVKVIILTMENGQNTIIDLIKRGTKGFLSKAAEPEELMLAIETVLVKDYFMNEYLTLELIDRSKNKNSINDVLKSNSSTLSQRELDILQLTCHGLAMCQIAAELCISERTVHNHRGNMMKKLNVKNVNGLITYAHTNQIFSPLHHK